MLRKILQLSFIHVAVAMTLVPINSTLNRVMIKEMAIAATIVALLASLPYIFSPTQIMIGSYSDRHPIFGWRRTPYIALGLVLCVAGVALAPQAVFFMPENRGLGLILTLLTFAAWGMGYNISAVSYLSLASELSGEKGRTRTVAVMWFMMILGIIFTAAGLSRLLEPYTEAQLERAFTIVALIALVLGSIGLIGLEPRNKILGQVPSHERTSWRTLIGMVLANKHARRFFLYLILLLAAILGQDVLLEPFAGEAFGMPVAATTRITSIWGVCVLLTLAMANFLEKPLGKRRVAQMGAILAIAAFVLIAASGIVGSQAVFYAGVVLLGLGTGLATVSNLSLMLDMTTTQVGLYIGAWGIATALARLVGTITSGVLRDLITGVSANVLAGYITVFFIFAGLLVASLLVLRRIDVLRFRQESQEMSIPERAALMNET
jgi:MFS transporter, BCD family, chlorophyll transporter